MAVFNIVSMVTDTLTDRMVLEPFLLVDLPDITDKMLNFYRDCADDSDGVSPFKQALIAATSTK